MRQVLTEIPIFAPTKTIYTMKHPFLFSLCLLFAMTASPLSADRPVKVACIGNSITYGAKIENRERDAYPSQLQRLLGDGYEVGNFGKNGATLLRRAYRPYFDQKEFREAMQFAGDIVVIHLGINDTDPRAWPNYGDEFVTDYLALIDSLRSVNPRARFIIARMTPIADRHPRFQSGTKLWHGEIQEAIETVARVSGAELIDFHRALYPYPWMLPDAIHPNEEGAGLLARTVYGGITGDYGGLQLPPTFSDNMILQRRQPLTLRGTADAGDRILLQLTASGKKVVAQAEGLTDNRGDWALSLPALQAAEGLTLTVSATPANAKKPARQFTCHNVAVGEVWLCSGQSNMAFRMDEERTGRQDAALAADPALRLFDMKEYWPTDNVTWAASAIDSVRHLQYYRNAAWHAASPEDVARFSAVAYHFGRVLRDSLRCPVGLICNAIGGSTTESWIDRNTLETQFPAILRDWLHNDFIQDWCRGRAAKNLGIGNGTPPPLYYTAPTEDFRARHPYEPCYLYEAGIEPLRQFPLRGVIWYQGESNAHNLDTHARLFRLLVRSWRSNWGQPRLPFHFVQLSSLNRPSWPAFRDSQRRLAADVPATGMVVTTDVGDSLNVHPTDKRTVGERLARLALVRDYDFNLLPAGPEVLGAAFRNGRVVLRFRYAQGLRTADGQLPRTFEVAGPDGLFRPASARIEGEGIAITCPAVAAPQRVRYAWQPFTRANVCNADGLPLSTFVMDVQ